MTLPTRLPRLFYHRAKLCLGVVQYKALFLAALVRNGFRSRYILSLPDLPSSQSALYKIAHRLGYRLTQDSHRHADIAIAWEDCTVRTKAAEVEAVAETRRVLNIRVADIGKQRVDEVFERTFGYSLRVDPENHTGPLLRKSEANAQHDGQILEGPVRPEPGFAYQRLVQNHVGGLLEEVRVYVFGHSLPFGLLQRYPTKHRFTLEAGEASLHDINELFSSAELEQLRRFCSEMGLDYGAIDVLRDSDDGRIYVVDVNNTPFGPVNRRLDDPPWFDATAWDGLNRMCDAFERAFGVRTGLPDFRGSEDRARGSRDGND